MSTTSSENLDRSALGGILLACAAFTCFSCLDTTAKFLSRSLPIYEIVWLRFVGHVILTGFLFRVWSRPHLIVPRRALLQFVRALCMLGATAFNFLALRHLQLDEAVSIMFATPFVVTALAGPILGEWAGLRRWIAILVGFLGVLIVTRPGFGDMHWAAIYSVAAMTSYAFYTLTTRMLTATETPQSMLMLSGIIPAIAMAPPALSTWQTPADWQTWGLLAVTGFFGSLGHWLLIKAYTRAPAPVIAPFMYTQIVSMVALGLIVFSDVPGFYTILGSSVIISSGLYLLYREQIRKKRT
ncbi:MAG: EamA family transporter [Hyphomicrobiales bacterium]|nr:MAG: EamA family transporter [Hyphomicrobiales bacterium]